MAVEMASWRLLAGGRRRAGVPGGNRGLVVGHTGGKMATNTAEEGHRGIFDASGIDTRSLGFQLMDDQLQALAQDVEKVRSSPYLPAGVDVGGFLYDVRTGLLREVV